MTTPFAAELACAIDLACEAAELIETMALGPPEVRYKEGDRNNPVTQYDVAIGEHILRGLTKNFPHDFVLSEEDEASHSFETRKLKRRIWCVDPIDGTRSFVAKTPEYAVMIGLAVDRQAKLGVLLAPATRTLWAGTLGDDGHAEAFVRRDWRKQSKEALVASPNRDLGQARLVMSGMRGSRLVEEVAHVLHVEGARMRMASVGLKAARIAEGLAEAYISPSNKTHEWDACAPEAVARAAGAKVTDLFGQPLVYNKETTPTHTGLFFSNGPNHALIAATLLKVSSTLAPQAVQQAAMHLLALKSDKQRQ